MLSKIGLAVVGVLVIALIMQYQYASHLKERVAIERQAYERAVEAKREARAETLEALDDLAAAERQRRDAEAAVQALQEEMAEQAEDYDMQRQRIQRTPTSDDGPVAPVLRDTLEALP
ncbi:hypothetical protein [Halomonas llamarensis]|uniref:DUF2570 domain-containing protein n=1 Tax=Halomonas llamarensis TaxID=2945104 RepID=A0ABT0SWE4_9GAMM|nr:hypothetical protein [Halomonas llamarensis]MCL7931624.1 hypothetical protein [Halomonas llamarensis]